MHITLYGVEAFLIYLAVRWPGRDRFSLARVLAIAAAMAVWGSVDETHQAWIPGRSMEATDAMADTAGASVGALLASAFTAKRRVSEAPTSLASS